MPEIVRLPVIEPRFYQLPFRVAMDRGIKRCVKAWHRRAGKDIEDFQYMIRQACRRVGSYYYYFPTLELAKRALWRNIVEIYSYGKCVAAGNMVDILCPPSICRRNESEHELHLFNGSMIKLGGTDNLSVIGMNGYGYVFSEWQSQKKEAFGYISPILRENGGWALFNGTMRGKHNHLYKDIQQNMGRDGWFAQWLRPQDTQAYYWVDEEYGISVNPHLQGLVHPHTLLPYDNIADQVASGEISLSLAKQEYLNDAVIHIGGTYYKYEIEKMVSQNRYKSLDPYKDGVYTFWDLGGAKNQADKTSITFAQMNSCTGPVKIVDYYCNTGRLRGHYFDVLKQKGYNYLGHYVPHDSKRSNEWTGDDMLTTARMECGVELRAVPKTNDVDSDIEAVRCDMVNWEINSDSCSDLFTDLSSYHESAATEKPCHKNNCSECHGASHGADSARTMTMARKLKLVEPYLAPKRHECVVMQNDDDYFLV